MGKPINQINYLRERPIEEALAVIKHRDAQCKYLSSSLEALEQENERLVAALTEVKSDLLRRGEKDSQGVVAVNLSSSVWLQLCDALAHKEDQ